MTSSSSTGRLGGCNGGQYSVVVNRSPLSISQLGILRDAPPKPLPMCCRQQAEQSVQLIISRPLDHHVVEASGWGIDLRLPTSAAGGVTPAVVRDPPSTLHGTQYTVPLSGVSHRTLVLHLWGYVHIGFEPGSICGAAGGAQRHGTERQNVDRNEAVLSSQHQRIRRCTRKAFRGSDFRQWLTATRVSTTSMTCRLALVSCLRTQPRPDGKLV